MPGALLIFLAPPDMDELERRLRQRESETAEEMDRRIRTATDEMAARPEFDYVVVNPSDRLDDTVAEIEEIIEREKAKRATAG